MRRRPPRAPRSDTLFPTRRSSGLATGRELLKSEAASGAEHGERMAAIGAEDAALATRLEELEARWEQEKALVAQLHEKLDALDALAEDAPERADAAVAINARRAEPARVKGRVSAEERRVGTEWGGTGRSRGAP